MGKYSPNLQRWFDYQKSGKSREALAEMLHDDVVFISPVVHTPQEGKAITLAYLTAAGGTLGAEKNEDGSARETFRNTRVFDCGSRAVIEFETEMDGILVNGVDMIEWDENGKITEFKVMVRPLKAMQKVHADMAAMLAKMQAGAPK